MDQRVPENSYSALAKYLEINKIELEKIQKRIEIIKTIAERSIYFFGQRMILWKIYKIEDRYFYTFIWCCDTHKSEMDYWFFGVEIINKKIKSRFTFQLENNPETIEELLEIICEIVPDFIKKYKDNIAVGYYPNKISFPANFNGESFILQKEVKKEFAHEQSSSVLIYNYPYPYLIEPSESLIDFIESLKENHIQI